MPVLLSRGNFITYCKAQTLSIQTDCVTFLPAASVAGRFTTSITILFLLHLPTSYNNFIILSLYHFLLSPSFQRLLFQLTPPPPLLVFILVLVCRRIFASLALLFLFLVNVVQFLFNIFNCEAFAPCFVSTT